MVDIMRSRFHAVADINGGGHHGGGGHGGVVTAEWSRGVVRRCGHGGRH